MTIAIRILVKIVLMILFGCVEVLQRQFLHGHGLFVVFLLFGKDLLNDGQINWVGIVDASTITSALVVSLFIETGGIDGLEEHLQQEFKADHIRIEPHEDRFCIACLIGIDLLVCRILCLK